MIRLRAKVVGIGLSGNAYYVQLKFEGCSSSIYDEIKLLIPQENAPRLGEEYTFVVDDIRDVEVNPVPKEIEST